MIATLQDIDSQLMLALNGLHTPVLDPLMDIITGRAIWVPLYIAIAAYIVWRWGWRRGIFLIAVCGLAVALSDYLCASVIRPLVERMRPANPMNPLSEFIHIVGGYRGGAYGFPSCHGCNTFALAVFSSLLIGRRPYTILIFAWAIVLCYSRIYLGVHYPGDIIAGCVIGSAIAATLFLASRWLLRPGSALSRIMPPVPERPAKLSIVMLTALFLLVIIIALAILQYIR